jgi:hypothetical protein
MFIAVSFAVPISWREVWFVFRLEIADRATRFTTVVRRRKTDSYILELAPSSIESYYSLIYSAFMSYAYVLSVFASIISANLNYGFDQTKIRTN